MKIKIKIEFVGYLDIKNVKDNTWVEMEQSLTISEFLLEHGIDIENQKYIISTVNKKVQPLTSILCNNDELFLHLPVGGG